MSVYYLDGQMGASVGPEFDVYSNDPSLNGEMAYGLLQAFRLNSDDFSRLFFAKYKIDYISQYAAEKELSFRVVTYPCETNTCFEKAEQLDSWDPLNVIKALYFEYSEDNSLYAVVVPETGCFVDMIRLKNLLKLPSVGFLKKTTTLPLNMSFGTCSPFIVAKDLHVNGGRVAKILFDTETLVFKKKDSSLLDDFSFGLNHRMSVQMNYYQCYRMLKKRYPTVVDNDEILTLAFKEKFVRNKGTVRIHYEFKSLNYRTALFINSIHGYGDVTVVNDYVDELDLPTVLTHSKQ